MKYILILLLLIITFISKSYGALEPCRKNAAMSTAYRYIVELYDDDNHMTGRINGWACKYKGKGNTETYEFQLKPILDGGIEDIIGTEQFGSVYFVQQTITYGDSNYLVTKVDDKHYNLLIKKPDYDN